MDMVKYVRIRGLAAVVILAIILVVPFACAVRPPAGPVTAAVPQEPAALTQPAPSPPPKEKVWAHTFVRTFSPPWKARAGGSGQTIVVPVMPGEAALTELEVALGCSIMSWNAEGTMRFKVEVSGYPPPDTGSLADGILEAIVTPNRHNLSADKVLTVQIPAPQGVSPLCVRVTRDAASDTFNQDPAVLVLRVSY